MGDRIDAAIGLGAIDCRHLARFCERNFMQGAEPKIPPLPIDGEPHGPALAAIRIDLEIETDAIGVPAGGFEIFNSCKRQTIETLGLPFLHVRRDQKKVRGLCPTFYPTFYPTAMRVLSGFIARRKVHILRLLKQTLCSLIKSVLARCGANRFFCVLWSFYGKWRMRWKPLSRTWIRKRRMNSPVSSVI